MTIKDVEDRDDLQLIVADYDVRSIKNYFGEYLSKYGGFFVNIHNDDIVELYGFEGNIPLLYKQLDKII